MTRIARSVLARRVLVVEDDKDLAELLRNILGSWGCEVRVAVNGVEGLAAARAFLPEVVICHVGPFQLEGSAVVRALRADPALDGFYGIALTVLSRPEDRRLAREAGFDLCIDITKPAALVVLERALSAGTHAGMPPSPEA
jgi:CheY-like chemotaxis protein